MAAAPSRRLIALYAWTTRLMPESHRWRYADEQVRLFEQVWMEERPDGGIAQLRWACVLIVQSVLAAIGARLDVSRRGGYARNVHRRGGAGMGSDFRFTLRSVRASSGRAGASGSAACTAGGGSSRRMFSGASVGI